MPSDTSAKFGVETILNSGPETQSTQPRTLKRSMRVIGALLLTLSAITPASSVFVIVPQVFQVAGTGGFLSMAATAFVSLSVAYVYAELASAFPIAGGEYSMVGMTIGPATGFATLALTAIGNMLAPAVLALGAADYVSVLCPGLDARVIGVAIIVATTLFGILHIRTNAWVTGLFLFLELLALVVLAILGFSHVARPLSELVLHPVSLGTGGLGPTTASMLVFSASASIFAYNGYGAAVYFSEEMHEAPRLVARTIMWALIMTVVTELVPVTAVLMGAPDIKTFLSTDPASKVGPISYFVRSIGGNALNVFVSLSVALAILNAVLATVLQNGRFFYSSGRDDTWHWRINEAFTLVHSRFNSPWMATLVSGATAVAACFIPQKLLVVLTGTGIVLVYVAVSFGALIGRLTGSTSHAAYRMPWFPLIPVLAVLSLAFIVYASWLDPANGRPSLIANVAVILAAVLYYRFVLLRRGAWALSGPADHSSDVVLPD